MTAHPRIPKHLAVLALVVLAAVMVCTLIAGTPVNNDPSPAANRAGIHLTHLHAQPRVATAASKVLAAFTLALLLLAAFDDRRPIARVELAARWRSPLDTWAIPRRGPPAPAR